MLTRKQRVSALPPCADHSRLSRNLSKAWYSRSLALCRLMAPKSLAKRRAKHLTHCFAKPCMEQVAIEAWVPDHRVLYRRDLFRCFQTLQGWHGRCDASRHRKNQVCRFKHLDRGQEIGQVDSHATLQAGFTKRTIDEVLLARLCFHGDVAKAEVLLQRDGVFSMPEPAVENAKKDFFEEGLDAKPGATCRSYFSRMAKEDQIISPR